MDIDHTHSLQEKVFNIYNDLCFMSLHQQLSCYTYNYINRLLMLFSTSMNLDLYVMLTAIQLLYIHIYDSQYIKIAEYDFYVIFSTKNFLYRKEKVPFRNY